MYVKTSYNKQLHRCVRRYNDAVKDVPGNPGIEDCGDAGENALVLLIGNSKQIWEPFVHEYNANKSGLQQCKDPLDSFISRHVSDALANMTDYRIFWAHKSYETRRGGGRGFLAFQRLAECAGMAYLDHISHLSIHPTYGSWYSLRCAVVFDTIVAEFIQPDPLPDPFMNATAASRHAVREAFENAQKSLSTGHPPQESWKLWVSVREAVSPHHPHRFSDTQIAYHYTQDTSWIKLDSS